MPNQPHKKNKKLLVVIAGPTAIGKTRFAITLAKQFKSEILSADSRQFYKEISIGTAKPSISELAEIKHHFINSHSIFEEMNAGIFETQALELIQNLFKKNRVLFLVGGSGLYIRAVCDGLDTFPPIEPDVRKSIAENYKNYGLEYLQKEVEKKDPVYFAEVDKNNPQRLMRALEVCIGTGLPYSGFKKNKKETRDFEVLKIGLQLDREKLYTQINNRVLAMMDSDLLEEVKSVYPHKNINALQTVGYTELFDYLDNKVDLESAIASIQQNTRRFAKRQITWFRREEEIIWVSPEDDKQIVHLIAEKLA